MARREVTKPEEEIVAGYDSWRRSRLAARMASTAHQPVRNHLITILVCGSASTGSATALTLSTLLEQTYRNIEILVAGAQQAELPDPADFTALRGLFAEPALDPLDVLAKPATDHLWRGSHIVLALPGTTFDPDAFALLNRMLSAAEDGPPTDLILCDHDRSTGAGQEPCFLPSWDPDLIMTTDYVGTAFMASRKLVVEQRLGEPAKSLHGWLRGLADRPLATTLLAETIMHLPRSAASPWGEISHDRPHATKDTLIQRSLRHVRNAILRRQEIRPPMPDIEQQPLPSAPDIEQTSDQLQALAQSEGVFDAEWYLSVNRDVAEHGIDPFTHYMGNGWREGRKPARGIDIEAYASMFPGFRLGDDNPMLFVLQSGHRLDAAQRKLAERQALQHPTRLEDGLCVVGYLCSEIGLGQAARNIVYACDVARLPVSARSVTIPGRDNAPEFVSKSNPAVDRKAQLTVTGLAAAEQYGGDSARDRLNILFPFWELGQIPRHWHDTIRSYGEVWAPSRFVASALADISGLTLHYVPQPVLLPLRQPAPRLNRTTLRFFTYLDFDSYVARKNPQAAVNAFRAAFPSTQRDVELIVKTRGKRDEGLRDWLGEVATQDQRIRIIDRTLDRAGIDALMAGCDAFISLHRSEGFGFGAAEALAAGKAVVSTDYGGTTDFINELTGYPVAYTLEAVRSGEYVQTENQVWATAKADSAVEALRAIHASPDEAEARARRGFALLKQQNALAVVGQRIAHILGEHGLIRR